MLYTFVYDVIPVVLRKLINNETNQTEKVFSSTKTRYTKQLLLYTIIKKKTEFHTQPSSYQEERKCW